jgi:DNA-directed RNA polymerase subunit M/transcription elongation factor TFIIS
LACEAQTAQRNRLDDDAAWLCAREAEAELYSMSPTVRMYRDQLLRAACNVHINGSNCGPHLVVRSDASHTKGTIIEAIRENRRSSKKQFESMLRDKRASARQSVDSASVSLKCRRCGSADVTWDVKQTRSSDESSTAFCVCSACANRWVIK